MNEEGNIRRTGVIIQGFDIIDITGFIGRTNKKYQATLLAQLEEVLGRDTEQYELVRKLVLDSTNNFVRAIVKAIFGEINA